MGIILGHDDCGTIHLTISWGKLDLVDLNERSISLKREMVNIWSFDYKLMCEKYHKHII